MDKEGLLEGVAYMLYLDSWLNEGEGLAEISDQLLKDLRIKWVDHWTPASRQEHAGDCTKECFTCIRCAVEELYTDAKRILVSFDYKGVSDG